jgi:mediator of RNA polymerase II transcription subunit 18, fungi type
MHELFLTAHIGNDDLTRSVQILQGYCAMSPTPLLRRRLFWNGPLTHNRGLHPGFLAAQGPKTRLWRSLSEQLIRQAYIVVLLYDITRDQFPKPETPAEEQP